MKSFDRALEECLEWIKNGQTVETCLRRYPQYAGRLAPLLRTALELKDGARIQPTEAFRQRGRAELAAYMDSHPQDSSRRLPLGPAYPPYSKAGSRRLLPAGQVIVIFSALVFGFFATGTVLAQSALPGQSLYPWKLTSETVWQAVSPDPIATNLALAQRRAHEALAVTGPDRSLALKGYENILQQLATQSVNDISVQQRVVPVLTTQKKDLQDSGISVPKLDEYLSHPGKKLDDNSENPASEPTITHGKHEKPSPTASGEDQATPSPTANFTPTPTPGTVNPGPPPGPATELPSP